SAGSPESEYCREIESGSRRSRWAPGSHAGSSAPSGSTSSTESTPADSRVRDRTRRGMAGGGSPRAVAQNVGPRTRTARSRPAERPPLSEPPGEGTLCAMASTARALLLDLGGVVLRNGRELVRGSVVDGRPELAAYVEEVDFAGDSDGLWQAMLRH